MKTLLRMRLNHFQNEAYMPQMFTRSSHPENLSVLMGWQSGIRMVFQNEAYIYILKSLKLLAK